MGFFGVAHELGGRVKKPHLPKICHIHSTMMKLGTVTPYLKKTPELCESRDTSLDFWRGQNFLRKQILLYQKIQI